MNPSHAAVRARRLTAGLALAVAALLALPSAAPARVEAATIVTGTASQLLARLPTASEHPAGYARSKFVLWIDADHDGCNTRAEVLIAESRVTATIGAHCAVTGSWRSAYDGVTTTKASSFDIDHVVPLKEAWDSGAWQWTADQRTAYANDLGDSRTLRAVSAASNRSKGDRDPADWWPPALSFRCVYAGEWVAVKTRWQLSVDSRERTAVASLLGTCPVKGLRVAIAPALASGAPAPGGTSVPTTGPTPAPTATAGPARDACDPSYPTVCIPPPPPDLNCGDIPYRNFTVLPPDPHRFDGDHDGIGCET